MADALRTVRKNTLQIAEEIPEAQYGFTPAPECRSVARLLTHIALGIRFQQDIHVEGLTQLAGYDFAALMQRLKEEEAKPRTKAEIIDLLRKNGETWASWVEKRTDEFLAERVHFSSDPPSSKSRFEMLLSTKEHEMHHRGQLMLIERMLGIIPHLTRERQARMQAQR